MCGHPLTTVSKLYKIVSELFLECLKTQKNYTFSPGFFSEFRFVRVIFRRLNNIYLFYVP